MDRQQFILGVTEHREALYRMAKTILRSDSECEDAVSEAILKAYNKLYLLRDERYFKTWLVRIVINTCHSYLRKNRFMPLSEEVLSNTPDEADDYRYLYEAVMALPEKIRCAVVLHYIEGYSVSEVARITRSPEGTVKSRLFKGRELLRLELVETEESI